jgi:hypothetical protein
MIVENNYENAKAGVYIGVVVDVIDLLNVPTQNGPKNFVRIIWVLDQNDSKGKPYRVMKQVSASLNEKSNLYKVAKNVFGVPPNPSRFDTESFMGRANQLFVTVEKAKNGKDYSNVEGILPLPNGAVIPAVPGDFVRAKDKKPFTPGAGNGQAPVQANPAPTTVSQLTQATVAVPAPTSNVQF